MGVFLVCGYFQEYSQSKRPLLHFLSSTGGTFGGKIYHFNRFISHYIKASICRFPFISFVLRFYNRGFHILQNRRLRVRIASPLPSEKAPRKRGAFSLGRGIAISTRQGSPCRRSHLLANPAVGLPLAGNGCIASKHEEVETWCLFTWQRYRDKYAARRALPSFAFACKSSRQ